MTLTRIRVTPSKSALVRALPGPAARVDACVSRLRKQLMLGSAAPRAAVARPQRRSLLSARASSSGADAPQPPPLRVSLRTAEARASLRFAELRSGSGRAATVIAVSAVADESEAWALGVRPGDRLLGISDPVRPAVLWELADSASLRFVRDALRLRVSPSIELQLGPGAAADALRASQAGQALAAVPAARPGLTVAEALEEVYAAQDRGALPTVSERRIKKREAYMEEVGKRNDSGFFATFAAVVLSTPLIILAVAAANGWLMTPYSLH